MRWEGTRHRRLPGLPYQHRRSSAPTRPICLCPTCTTAWLVHPCPHCQPIPSRASRSVTLVVPSPICVLQETRSRPRLMDRVRLEDLKDISMHGGRYVGWSVAYLYMRM